MKAGRARRRVSVLAHISNVEALCLRTARIKLILTGLAKIITLIKIITPNPSAPILLRLAVIIAE